jgi:hypothetical protein
MWTVRLAVETLLELHSWQVYNTEYQAQLLQWAHVTLQNHF